MMPTRNTATNTAAVAIRNQITRVVGAAMMNPSDDVREPLDDVSMALTLVDSRAKFRITYNDK